MPVPRFSEKFYRDFSSSFAPQFFNKMVSLRLILMPNVPEETEREKNAGPRKEKKSQKGLAITYAGIMQGQGL